MVEKVLVAVETIKAVLVGTHPTASTAVDHGADDASLTDNVLVAYLVAYIAEGGDFLRLHEDTLLQQSKPNTTVGIFNNAVDLAFREVDIATEIGIVGHFTGLGIIDAHAVAVVANHQLSVVSAIERRNVLGAGHVEMTEISSTCRAQEDSPVRGTHIYIVFSIDTDAHHFIFHAFIGKMPLHGLAVIFEES